MTVDTENGPGIQTKKTVMFIAITALSPPAASAARNDSHGDGARTRSGRIDESNATRVEHWRDTTPFASAEGAGGNALEARNPCSNPEGIPVRMDVHSATDRHMNLKRESRATGPRPAAGVRDISRSVNRFGMAVGDGEENLYRKKQAAKVTSRNNEGKARWITVTSSTCSPCHQDVGTHEARRETWQDCPGQVYCGADSKDDAFTSPPTISDNSNTRSVAELRVRPRGGTGRQSYTRGTRVRDRLHCMSNFNDRPPVTGSGCRRETADNSIAIGDGYRTGGMGSAGVHCWTRDDRPNDDSNRDLACAGAVETLHGLEVCLDTYDDDCVATNVTR